MTRYWPVITILVVVIAAICHEWITDPIYHLPDRPLKWSEAEIVCKSVLARVARHHVPTINLKSFRLVYAEHNKGKHSDYGEWDLYYFSKQDAKHVYKIYCIESEDGRAVDSLELTRQEFLNEYGHKMKADDREYVQSYCAPVNRR